MNLNLDRVPLGGILTWTSSLQLSCFFMAEFSCCFWKYFRNAVHRFLHSHVLGFSTSLLIHLQPQSWGLLKLVEIDGIQSIHCELTATRLHPHSDLFHRTTLSWTNMWSHVRVSVEISSAFTEMLISGEYIAN